MLSRAPLVLLLAARVAAQTCSDTQYLTTKPVCSGNGRCCVEGNVVGASGTSGTISDARNANTPVPSECTWIIGPFPQITIQFTSFDTEVYPLDRSKLDSVTLFFASDRLATQWTKERKFFAGYDGRQYSDLPGSTTYSSQSGYLMVWWKMTEKSTRPGFVATWTVGPSPAKYPVCNVCAPNMQNTNKAVTSISACSCNPGWVGQVHTSGDLDTQYYWNDWCRACTPGKYKASLSALACSDCPARSSSPAASSACFCTAGFDGNPFATCAPCLPGLFKPSIDGACAACPAGTISTANASSACTTCAVGSTSSVDRRRCETCPDGTQAASGGRCEDCRVGFYSSAETNRLCVQCPAGFYSTTTRTAACLPCLACPDGFHRANCAFDKGGGACVACRACPAGLVNVGCMNRAGHTDKPGACRNRTYVVRTPLCDEKDSGLGLGGYTFLGLFGVSQNDASFQCRRRCDNQQNIMSTSVYKDNATFTELLRLFPNVKGIPQAFNGGHCGGPYACDVANCNIPGSSDDSQTDYQPKLACPVYIEPAMASAFWAAIDAKNTDATAVAVVNAMRAEKCQTCATCGQGTPSVQDWGRGCARDCTQLSCEPGLIFDWTEPEPTAKCKKCGDLDDVRLCLSSEQASFAGYDVSGRLPKIYMRQCNPKRQLPLRGYEISYGSCVKCADFAEACASDTYYHTCEESGAGVAATCRACSRAAGRDPLLSRFWDGAAYRRLYCQQGPCPSSAGLAYTGVATETTPHRICHAPCKPVTCDGGPGQVVLPCVLPHQRRCMDSVDMDAAVNDAEFRALAFSPAHANILEPNTTEPHLFASFENVLIDHDAPTLALRATCVWNADFVPDNAVNPAGVSARFQRECTPWARDPRMQYPLMPLQNTVADSAAFPRRVLLNTSASAVSYSQGSVPRPAGVFAGHVFLELNLTNANNATLAAFVPPDRGLEAALWVPRWRAAVHARQLSGGDAALALSLAPDPTCFTCFQLRVYPETLANATAASASAALALFRGDKFVFSPSPDLLVCEKAVQARAYPAFLAFRYDASLAAFFASSLTDACVSAFGVRSQPMPSLADVLRSSDVITAGTCLAYATSPTRVFCIRRAGGVEELVLLRPAQGTLVDLAVLDGTLVRTVHSGLFASGDTANYMSLSSIAGTSAESVVQVAGLLMFARGAPRYFLRRTTADSLRLSKFDTSNATFRLNATATYPTNDVRILFSRFVPVSARNTLLEFANGFLVFATAKYAGSRVIAHVTALDVDKATLSTYSMPFAVFEIASGVPPLRIDDPYESIESAGEALLSCAWLARSELVLSVAVDGAPPGQFAPLRLNVSDLTMLPNAMHPDLARAFDAPFVRVASAVVSRGSLKTCAECVPASADASSGFFAYGASLISSRKLFTCTDANTYIEEDTARAFPIQTCVEVRTDAGGKQAVIMQLTLQCVASDPLEIVLQLPPSRRIFFGDGTDMSFSTPSRVLLSVPCSASLFSVVVFDASTCVSGCTRSLWSGGRLRIEGGIEISSIRHRSRMSAASETWSRRTLLQVGPPRPAQSSAPIQPSWREHSVLARSIAPFQQLNVSIQRAASVARIAAARDSENLFALDALAVLPVLSEHFMPVVVDSVSVLASIVYVPTRADLSVLALEAVASGDDILDWARVHASVHVTIAPDIQQCAYLARVVAVDATLAVVSSPSTLSTGCLLDLAVSANCHLELPERLANAARVVGLTLFPTSSACRALNDADDVSVELAPFMRIRSCPPNSFLRADALACAACDAGAPPCPAGQFVRGCRPLVHPQAALDCVNCSFPNNSFFPNTSRGCDAWTCLSGFYREDKACARCTTLLTNVCRATGGLRRQNCTTFENEKCVDCQPKPRYSEWAVSSSECSWRCKPGFFQNSGACEACQTFQDTVAFLSISGLRVAKAFYRFQACSATSQSRSEICASNDFGVSLDGTYIADGPEFGKDCVLRCAENSNLHSVRANLTRAQATWSGQRCVACATADWPLFVNSSRLPRHAFEMSSSCVATCLPSAGFYAHANISRTCLSCPPGICPTGFHFSSSNNCTACQPCSRSLIGGVFTASGTFDNARSCPEVCPTGHFRDAQTCRPHSILTCRPGLQYFVAGTSTEDARCDTCADCSGAKEVSPCTTSANRQCESCGPLDTWSSAWSKTGCNLICRDGYTKLYTDGEICRKCPSCPPGQAIAAKPANCTCMPCREPIPAKAVFTVGCAWSCPLYHVAQVTNGALTCEYTIRPTSASSKLRVASATYCSPGQRLEPDTRPEAYGAFSCANCTIPAGMRAEDMGKIWNWSRACEFSCAWGKEKVETFGSYKCENMLYAYKKPPRVTQPPPSGLQTSHLIGIVVFGVVFVLFGLCFLYRLVT